MTATATSYAPLLLRSNYSLLAGTAFIDDILQKAVKFGIRSIALTDTNNLYGALSFYKKARALGIKPIIGTELLSQQNNVSGIRQRVFLLARDLDGYKNICRIITRFNLVPEFKYAKQRAIGSDILTSIAELHEGIYFLTDSLYIAKQLTVTVDREFIKLLIIRPDQNISTQRQHYITAKKMGIGIVGNCDIFFMEKHDYQFHKLLTVIKEGGLMSDASHLTHYQQEDDNLWFAPSPLPGRSTVVSTPRWLRATPYNYFQSPQEIAKRFENCPELLYNSISVADNCNLEIPMDRYIFPKYNMKDSAKISPYEHLYNLCLKGATWRYGVVSDVVINRLKYELEIINKLGFPEYFLVVGDIIRFARDRSIPVVGRGSGAGSIVAYTLGITNVDPLKYNLCFERFMHPLRKDYPDLDIDLCWKKRDEVIDYVYRKYQYVAMICTHNRFQLRSAFREAAKAYGIPNNQVNIYSKFIPRLPGCTLSEIAGTIPVLKELWRNNKSFNHIIKAADRLNGFPRHLGIHSGGIVIANDPIESYVPLEIASKGIVITQYEMHSIEDIGLIKIDLLGNRALSTITEAVKLVKKNHQKIIVPEKIPDREPKTVDLLKSGQTLGCFQIESPGMRNLLKMLRVSSIDETIASLSLIRPGPATGGLKELYVKRARGIEKTTHIDPRLEEVLKDSYGIMLYEEDAIRSASAITGESLARGDEFRRAIAKTKRSEDYVKVESEFIKNATRNGVKEKAAYSVCRYIANFASYTFCKAHAAGYGFIAYQGAYLKAHYPAEFIVSLLNNHQGMYERRVHIEDARRLGINILYPCINRSDYGYSVDNLCIRIGFMQVKGLSLKTIRQIISQREFSSLNSFLQKVNASHKETESLILCGSFDFTGKTRPLLMWELKTQLHKTAILNTCTVNNFESRRTSRQTFFGDGQFNDFISTEEPVLEDYSEEKKYWDEYKVLEIFVDQHPMKLFKKSLPLDNIIDSSKLKYFAGKEIKIAGILDAIRKTDTKKNERMMFVTMEDEKGMFEVTLFPSVYRKYSYLLKSYGPYIVEGKVEDQYGAITVTAKKIYST